VVAAGGQQCGEDSDGPSGVFAALAGVQDDSGDLAAAHCTNACWLVSSQLGAGHERRAVPVDRLDDHRVCGVAGAEPYRRALPQRKRLE
jgi:hypothetical protein